MATAISTSPVGHLAERQGIPLLVNGDKLTRDEFERRYRAMPNLGKAELIEGTVYMPSPVRYDAHGKPHSDLNAWLVYFAAKTSKSIGYADNATVRLDYDNEPQPDLFLMLPAEHGGRAKVDEDGYVSGAPTLVCEIAASTVSIDLHFKKTAYRRNGVQEYIVWRTEDSAVDWFGLQAGDFVPLPVEPDGTIHSRVFPGLWLNPASLIAGDLPAVFALLDKGVNSSEHAQFVKRLAN